MAEKARPSAGLGARTGLAAAALLAALLAAEGGFRAAGYGDPVLGEGLRIQWTPDAPFERSDDPAVLVAPRAGWRGAQRFVGDTSGEVLLEVPVALGELGERLIGEAGGEAVEGEAALVAIGDSITFGWGVRAERAWPARLAAALGGRAVNLAVPSYNLHQSVLRLHRHSGQLEAGLVVLGFYTNDLLPAERPEALAAELRRELPAWARQERGLRRYSFVLNQASRAYERRRWSQQLFGEVASVNAVIREQASSPAALRGAALDLEGLARSCEELGARCVVALIPSMPGLPLDPMTDLLDAVGGAASEAGLEVVDLTPTLQSIPPERLYVLPGDLHPGEEAHEAIAEALARALEP